MLRSGRIDSVALHDGLPAEPLMILMKHLAREVREQTAWSQRLAGTILTWQFDTAAGLKYAASFDAAPDLADVPACVVRLRMARHAKPTASSEHTVFFESEGLFGDGAFEFQEHLMAVLRRLIAER